MWVVRGAPTEDGGLAGTATAHDDASTSRRYVNDVGTPELVPSLSWCRDGTVPGCPIADPPVGWGRVRTIGSPLCRICA